MTIHWSKFELKRLRCLENRVERISIHPMAIMFRELNIQIFPRTPRLAKSELGKSFKYASEVELGMKPRLLMLALDLVATKGLPTRPGAP